MFLFQKMKIIPWTDLINGTTYLMLHGRVFIIIMKQQPKIKIHPDAIVPNNLLQSRTQREF